MMSTLGKAIAMTLLRRALGYLGVGAVVGLDNEIVQVAGVALAAGSAVWSIVAKIRAARAAK